MGADEARATLEALLPSIELAIAEVGSEQDTRLQIINRMLTEVCGWRFEQIKTEVPNDQGFADYALWDERHARVVCVLEAKKKGNLVIDTVSSKKTEVQLGGSVLKKAKEGIDQAVGYCVEMSCNFAVVTDGNSWIFFRLSMEGRPLREKKAIVFPELASALDDFATFYELLSFEAVQQRLHLARLNQVEGFTPRATEPRYYVKPPEEARLQPRSEFSRDISEVFNRFFAGMSSETDSEMRRSCFVETRESQVADATLGKIATHLVNTIQLLETEQSQALKDEIAGTIASKQSEICLIVGNKGAGKSTFIERFFQDVLPSELRAACVTAVVNLADFTGDQHSLQRWLSERLRDRLEDAIFSDKIATYEDYMGMFFGTYRRWSEATYRDLYATDKTAFKIRFGEYVERRRSDSPDEYVLGLLRHTAASRLKLPCVVFDNTDQHTSAIQEAVFQYAVSLRNGCICFLLVPITDRSIWRLSKSGSFQSYTSRTFFLPSPPAREILQKRVRFIERKLEEDAANSGTYFSSKGIRVSITNLNAFVKVLEEAFIRDSALSGLIARLANFDIRRMMLLAQRTICSPSFRVEDLIKVYVAKQNQSGFDFRRAIRALILGEYDRHLDQTSEFVSNVFATDGSHPYSPFLVLSIFELLSGMKRQVDSNADVGYLAAWEIIDYFAPCHVDAEDVRYVLKSLLRRRLIEPLEPDRDDYYDALKVGITYAGEAHQELALCDVVYAEQMAVTTGIRLEAVRSKLSLLSRNMGDRETRETLVSTFVDHLLDEDARKMTIPPSAPYSVQRKLRSELRARRS
ncbi:MULTISPECIES: hypothetical protein [unclassified Bradyrhizobium]|uniref:hypothetical protein n=1 Tax=unclassified Bradyrhizobium TaxID=2631580 RepID=UPI002915F81F|nr:MULTISPECIES: hypothetical protein [unclassified Bradyrhizobium]